MECEPGLARGNFGLRYWNCHPEAAFFWAFNYYSGDPYVEYDGGGSVERTEAIVYPACSTSNWQPVGTINWEGVREARNDWAYAKTVEYLLAHDTGSAARAVAPEFTALTDRVNPTLFRQCDTNHYSVLDSARQVMAQWIKDMLKEAPGIIGVEKGMAEDSAELTRLEIGPNPFNPATLVTCRLSESSEVRLELYNVRGKNVLTLYRGALEKGVHRFPVRASALSSGMYWCRLKTKGTLLVKPLVLMK
jgi:hypothetical protein